MTKLLVFFGIIFCTMLGAAHADITTGLVNQWNFEIVNGSSVTDTGSQNSTGTLTSGAVITSGRIGNNGVFLDGVDDYIDLPVAVGTQFSGGNAITIATWFRGTTFQSAVRLQDTILNYIILGCDNGGVPEASISSDGGCGGGVTLSTRMYDGGWHHVAMTWEFNAANGFKTFVDGVVVSSRTSALATLPAISGAGYHPAIGRYGAGGELSTGIYDDVRIYNVTKSTTDMTELYNFLARAKGRVVN